MNRKSIINLIAVAAFGATLATGCKPATSRPDGDNQELDKSKTIVYCSNFKGAFGYKWLQEAAKRYEELHKDDVYQEGKKGVQIWIDNNKNGASDLLAGMSSNRDDIFFTEWAYYYDIVRSGWALDLTDIVTEKLTKYGETKSIEDKLTTEQKNFYNVDGHYYTLPHYQGFSGITYDKDFFADECLYFALDTANSDDGFIVSEDQEKSYGPDGLPGTYDDGLPATYDDFFKLCNRMKNTVGISPILFTGSTPIYYQWFSTALMADYEGLDQTMLNYTFKGTANSIVNSFDGVDNPVIGDLPITSRNGYQLAKQAGRYYSLKFTEGLVNGGYFDNECFGTLSHIDAQKYFINGGYGGAKRYGMLIDSNYWENEVNDVGGFAAMEKKYGANKTSRTARNFGFMPFPKATSDKIGQANTLVDYLCSGAFIKSSIEEYKKELALDFMQFLYTDVSLNEWTAVTGTPKSINYELTADTLSKLSPYSRDVLELRRNSDIVYPYANSEIYKNNASAFGVETYWETNVIKNGKQTPYSYPHTAMRNDKVTAKEYFLGLEALRSKDSWENSYSNFFED